MNMPIHGSQINAPAKLYKRFTPTESLEIDDTVIEYENNYYKRYHRFYWVESDALQSSEDTPITGMVAHTDVMSIKLYGRWKAQQGAVDEPESGDILEIDGECWVIEDGVQRERKKSLINVATVYLPLRKLL